MSPSKEQRSLRRPAWLLVVATAALCLVAGPVRAQSGSLTLRTVPSPAIASNLLGEPSDIEVAVYTPPGYSAGRLEYPVLYLLHGIGGTFRDWTEGGYQGLRIHEELDARIAEGAIPPMIVVMPTAMNRYLGSYYADSPVTGNWGAFVAGELVAWMDAEYRTIDSPGGRGIAGHSMGGFGALTLAMDHPGVYAAVYAMAPCCLALTDDIGSANPAWATAVAFETHDDVASSLQSGQFYPAAMVGLMSVAAPDVEDPPLYVDMPYRPDGGGFLSKVEPTFSAFRDFFPVERLDESAGALRGLRGLALDVGHDDQFSHIPPGAMAFSARLGELGVPHAFSMYDGDHRNRIRARLNDLVLPFFARHLDAPR